MNNLQKKRLYYFSTLLIGLSVGIGLILYALKQNINVFVTPTELVKQSIMPHSHLRLGGLVKPRSIRRDPENLNVHFIVTDNTHDIEIFYQGILPDLFREGTGVIAEGHRNNDGSFTATQVLAKHDENYMPKNVYKAIREKTS